MKKNLITLLTIASMLAAPAAVFAEQAEVIDGTQTIIQGDVMAISADTTVENTAPVSTPSYISNSVTIVSINDNMIETVIEGADASDRSNTINYVVNDKTVVIGLANGEKKSVSDIKVGDTVTMFVAALSPAPLIYPPQYTVSVIAVNDAAETDFRAIDVDTYLEDGDYVVNAANTLSFAKADAKGVEAADLINKDLIVIYGASTRSIPAKTTPIAVIVLGENEMALANLNAIKEDAMSIPNMSSVTSVNANGNVITNVYTKEDGTLMLPLRAVAESLGLTVEWNGEIKAVLLNGGVYTVTIGENSYAKGKMMPMQLASAPELTNDLTYVPAEYFTDVVETVSSVEGDVLTLKADKEF